MRIDYFENYRGEEIKLCQTVWEDHISEFHSEITKALIGDTLLCPTLVCESQHEFMKSSEQYYYGPWRNSKGRNRYYRVVVKTCSDGNWISTAHTRAKVSCGSIIHKEGDI